MKYLSVYQRLPGPLRSAAAGLRGLQLARRRYGAETAELVRAALERERWSEAEWDVWRRERLNRLLTRACTRAPYYRASGLDASSGLDGWPLLDKQTLRARAREFVADDLDRRALPVERTSGTTGTPLALWRSRRTTRARYALYEARHRHWYGVSRTDRWAMVAGQIVAGQADARPPYWVWNAPMRQLYVSSYHLAPEQAAASVREIDRRECRYAWGFPSSLTALARAALETRCTCRLDAVTTHAEPLLPEQRRLISQAFGCRVYETYGMVELAAAAGECEAGTLHLFPEFGIAEVLGDDGVLRTHGEGELVATGLLDLDMPLIRYRTGDRVRIARAPAPCACGRTLPVIDAIEGRFDDVLTTRDGQPVGRLDSVFKGDLSIREAQIIQVARDKIVVRVVPELGYGHRTEGQIIRALQARLGPVGVRIETLRHIPRGPNGKFRAVVNRIPDRLETTAREFAAAC